MIELDLSEIKNNGRWKSKMYAILNWIIKNRNDFVRAVANEDGSIKIFESISKADDYANKQENSDNLRVISIECVHE